MLWTLEENEGWEPGDEGQGPYNKAGGQELDKSINLKNWKSHPHF